MASKRFNAFSQETLWVFTHMKEAGVKLKSQKVITIIKILNTTEGIVWASAS